MYCFIELVLRVFFGFFKDVLFKVIISFFIVVDKYLFLKMILGNM